MKEPKQQKVYTVDVREPYMGNVVPLTIRILMDEDGYLVGVTVTSPEGIVHGAKEVVQPMNT